MSDFYHEHDYPILSKLVNLTGRVKLRGDEEVIRTGGFADIHRGELLLDPSSLEDVIVKIPRSFVDVSATYREIIMWQIAYNLAPECVLPLYGVSESFWASSEHPCFVSPYLRHGTLVEYVKRANPSMQQIRNIFVQIAKTLNTLHSRGIFHGDIKGNNILLSDNGTPLLSDFGLSQSIHYDFSFAAANQCEGNTRWQAPEVAFGEALTGHSDVWSFGMTMLEIMTQKPPYFYYNEFLVTRAVVRQELPERSRYNEISDELWDVLEMCWNIGPTARPTMQQTADLLCKIKSFGVPSDNDS